MRDFSRDIRLSFVQHIGPYQVVRRLAIGGMAEVYLAKTTGVAGFERHVALKLIHAHLADSRAFITMFVDEAKIAANLSHPNIAQTFDLGCADGRHYLAMEYVDGVDVYNLIGAARHAGLVLPFDACAFIARELASALEHAHERSVLHRDVAADNVLVSYTGAVKLVDFGIARATSRLEHTAVGVIKGKFAYMSPEQVSGGQLDATSDLYSLGIVLYEMLTGRTLYDETNIELLAMRIREGVFAPPQCLRPDVPPELEQIVMRALMRNPADRYQSAGELVRALQEFLQSYSPAFVTATLGAFVTLLMDRVGVRKMRSKTVLAKPPRRPSRHVIARKPRESDVDIRVVEDASKEIWIGER